MRLNKNIIIVFLLLSVFAVGTLNFADTVEAASWKKFDSGSYKADDGAKIKYTSYIKGTNKIHMKIYRNSKFFATADFVKTGQKVVITSKNPKGKIIEKKTEYTKKSLKKWYYS